jgi:hypothetical protein
MGSRKERKEAGVGRRRDFRSPCESQELEW